MAQQMKAADKAQGGDPHLEARVQSLEVRLEALLGHPHILAMLGPKAAAQAGISPAPTPQAPETPEVP